MSELGTISIQLVRIIDQMHEAGLHYTAVAYEATEASDRIRAPAKSKKIYLIAWLIAPHKKLIGVLNISIDTDANTSPKQLVGYGETSTDTRTIKLDLFNFCVMGFYGLIHFFDIRFYRLSAVFITGLVPCSVTTYYDAFHELRILLF
jgi:hypothetical protein